MSSLQGKVALVTGASKGIGAAIARELADRGAAVAVNYSGSKAAAEKVVAEIKAAGGKAIAVQANVADPDSIGPLIQTVVKQLGPIGILVNNAGVYEFGPIEAVTPEHFHKQFDLNVLGLLLTTQAALQHFDPAGGSIVNISSVAAGGIGSASVYSATKGAVDSITVALSKELGPRQIRVNSINPGLIETEGYTPLASLALTSRSRLSSKPHSAASASHRTSPQQSPSSPPPTPAGSAAKPSTPPVATASNAFSL